MEEKRPCGLECLESANTWRHSEEISRSRESTADRVDACTQEPGEPGWGSLQQVKSVKQSLGLRTVLKDNGWGYRKINLKTEPPPSLKRKQIITGSVSGQLWLRMWCHESRTQQDSVNSHWWFCWWFKMTSKSFLMTSSTSYSLKRQSLGSLQRCRLWGGRGMQRGNKGGFSSAPVFWDFLSLQPQFHKKHRPPGLS